ncbi:MAG: NAD(+)/NADH kinase [Metallosphaera sp.]
MRLKIINKESPEIYPLVDEIRKLALSMGFVLDDRNADLILAIGGDGTLLRAIDYGKPIMTVKAGRRGFLMDVEPKHVEEALDRLKKGDYIVEEYPLIKVKFPGGEREAFNEVGVLYDEPESIVITVSISDTSFTVEGDGVLVSTPQGSTGWSMSITGVFLMTKDSLEISLVSPILTPVKSLIVPRTEINLIMESKGYDQKARVVVDGNVVGNTKPGEKIVVSPSKNAIIYRFFKIDPVRGIMSWRK